MSFGRTFDSFPEEKRTNERNEKYEVNEINEESSAIFSFISFFFLLRNFVSLFPGRLLELISVWNEDAVCIMREAKRRA